MKYCKTCRCKMIRNRHYGSLKTCELVRQHQLQVSQLEERLRVALEQRDAATYHEPMPTDGREQLQQRITELEASMIRHFQEEHLEGDGPEIDRWKRVLRTSVMLGESLALVLTKTYPRIG